MTFIAAGCETAGKNTAYGAGIGAAAGAAAGAIIGHQSGNRGKGAAIGAAIGAAAGSGVGYRMDKQAKELEKVAETKRTENGIVSKLKSDILFDTGKFELKPQAVTNIAQMAAILKKYPENVITVHGYTDSTGTVKGNQVLSEKRAGAVRDEIVKGGVPAPTVNAIGHGRDNAVGNNKTAEGRAQNRRVEVEITVDESKVPKK
jgi:outer membrane protein OmpA-like peptidoglycan-associated protein